MKQNSQSSSNSPQSSKQTEQKTPKTPHLIPHRSAGLRLDATPKRKCGRKPAKGQCALRPNPRPPTGHPEYHPAHQSQQRPLPASPPEPTTPRPESPFKSFQGKIKYTWKTGGGSLSPEEPQHPCMEPPGCSFFQNLKSVIHCRLKNKGLIL